VLAFFASAIAAGFGRRRSSRGEVAVWLGLLAAGAVSAAGEWTWQIPAATAPIVVAAAVLTGPATLRPRWPSAVAAGNGGPVAGERSAFGIGVATLLAGFACIWIGGVSLLGTIQLDEARDAAAAGDADAAARNASYAGAIEPWSAAARVELAGAEGLRGRLDEARMAAEEAVDLAPGDYVTHLVLARILARQGERAAAEAELARAEELVPLPLGVALPGPDE
jgi:tetratricopeptide (TPR) repeat protein